MWDPREFSETYRRLAPVAVRAAERVLHDRAAAEDVAQDVFARLWERPQAYDPARGSLASYVAMVARSRALDRWRSRQAADAAAERLSYAEPAGLPPTSTASSRHARPRCENARKQNA